MACTYTFPLPDSDAPHLVSIPRDEVSQDDMCRMRAWLADEANGASGRYTYYTSYNFPNDKATKDFRFTDEMTAFYFKIRFR